MDIMPRNNSGANRTIRSRTTETSSSTPATSFDSNSGSANTTRARRPTTRQNNGVYGYQRSSPARNSTVSLSFFLREIDPISDKLAHYSAASIDPPVIEIADNDYSDQIIGPPPYSYSSSYKFSSNSCR
ncbi:hypothetical protein AYI69_g5597 [Smittium culicis]|uniref:Uncharacterized protein n=1 Tax=Smittium culicis TaxID=133412 RepID=A0A1R1Y4Q4_9FUNG|nr:hypothetical protein AYI69_g5597 [Smittium culicis]